MLVSNIYNRMECERFNIDNIEVRTGIDIPKVTSAVCECDNLEKIKTSHFTIDTKVVNIKDYVAKNRFVLKEGIYIQKGEREDTKWLATLDQSSNELMVRVEYRQVSAK